MASYPFVQAKHYRRGGNTPVSRLVIHDMEAPEKATTAESVAAYFAKGTVVSSCHYCIDSDSIIQCVREEDVAFHAPPNTGSIGLEHAGYARQTAEEWIDAYSMAMLRLSAGLAADICRRHNLPLVWLSPADLLAGHRGITSHANVSKAWRRSTHTDPGPNFPVDFYLSLIGAPSRVQTATTATQGDYVVPQPPPPPVQLPGGKMRQLVAIGPLDSSGRGWIQTDIPFAGFEAATVNAVNPEQGGYGNPVVVHAMNWDEKVRLVVMDGKPGSSVGVYVTTSP
jgi:N-acetyl-anhydromuramyl-L-alanine amidase AmpD